MKDIDELFALHQKKELSARELFKILEDNEHPWIEEVLYGPISPKVHIDHITVDGPDGRIYQFNTTITYDWPDGRQTHIHPRAEDLMRNIARLLEKVRTAA